MFFSYLLFTSYKDVINEQIKNLRVNRLEFFECRDLKSLESSLNKLYASNESVKSYTVYIYQPKDKAIYKTCLLTNDEMIKSSPKIYGVYLKNQPKLNEYLDKNIYIIENANNPNRVEIPLSELDYKFALVYRLTAGDKNIGEIMIGFKKYPEVVELDNILKELNKMTYTFII